MTTEDEEADTISEMIVGELLRRKVSNGTIISVAAKLLAHVHMRWKGDCEPFHAYLGAVWDLEHRRQCRE